MADDDLTYLSLFSGIGGLDLAIEAFGFRCAGQVEWDRSCQRVLERHWADVPRWGDVADFIAGRDPADPEGTGGGLDAGREPGSEPSSVSGRSASQLGSETDSRSVDLICGGFPCQPVSIAGRRKAQQDRRWLWPAFASVIRDVRPRWVVVENVPGLLGAGEPGGSALGEVLRDLATLGFDARWHCVRASDVGAPHRRERIFLLAHADNGGHATELRSPRFAGLHASDPGSEPRGAGRRAVADPGSIGRGLHEPQRGPEGREAVGRSGEGSPADAGHDGKHHPLGREPGNGSRGQSAAPDRVVTSDAGHDARQEVEQDRAATAGSGGGSASDTPSRGIRRGSASGQERRTGSDGSELASDTQDADGRFGEESESEGSGFGGAGSGGFAWGPYAAAIEGWERVMGPAPGPVDEQGRLAPAFVTWMMGFPAGWTDGMTRTQALKALGNAVVPHQAYHALRSFD